MHFREYRSREAGTGMQQATDSLLQRNKQLNAMHLLQNLQEVIILDLWWQRVEQFATLSRHSSNVKNHASL